MTTTKQEHAAKPVDLAALARDHRGPVPLWTEQCADMHVNVLSFEPGASVAEHVNAELDVVLVGVSGTGVVQVDGLDYPLLPSHAMMIPKGACRAIVAGERGLSYLSCHRRRTMLWPTAQRSAERSGVRATSPARTFTSD